MKPGSRQATTPMPSITAAHDAAPLAAEAPRSGQVDDIPQLDAAFEIRVRNRIAQLERSNRDLVRAKAAADRANRAKSEFISNMSHELRTPLNAIIGFGQLLNGAQAHPAQATREREFVSHIVSAGRHLLTLIDDILNLAQIEAGKLTLSLEPVALDELLADCRAMMGPLADKRQIRLVVPSTGGWTVNADRTRLRQVLLNLLSNAVKYNREHGSVVVDIARTSPDRLRLSVQDSGLGIRQDQMASLFQPFNRLGQERGKQEGTGIGLVLTRHLVELMGGSLGVSSVPGIGSRFWVELRADPPTVEGTPSLRESIEARHAAGAQAVSSR